MGAEEEMEGTILGTREDLRASMNTDSCPVLSNHSGYSMMLFCL